MENIFVLNPLADYIWERLDGQRSLKAIVAEIAGEFDVTAEQAGVDARDFVGQLLQRGLAEEVA
jgi:methyltransferase-like protein